MIKEKRFKKLLESTEVKELVTLAKDTITLVKRFDRALKKLKAKRK